MSYKFNQFIENGTCFQPLSENYKMILPKIKK